MMIMIVVDGDERCRLEPTMVAVNASLLEKIYRLGIYFIHIPFRQWEEKAMKGNEDDGNGGGDADGDSVMRRRKQK